MGVLEMVRREYIANSYLTSQVHICEYFGVPFKFGTGSGWSSGPASIHEIEHPRADYEHGSTCDPITHRSMGKYISKEFGGPTPPRHNLKEPTPN